MDGPSWLGIGAQRCGTTWFVDLLTQHPDVDLRADGVELAPVPRKEMHVLDGLETADDQVRDRYASAFPADGVLRGEFSPSYLRSPWAAGRAAKLVDPSCVLIALVRDPIDRFRSSLELQRKFAAQREMPGGEYRLWQSDAIWAGMYAPQLGVWRRSLPNNPLLVFDYQKVRADPQTAVDRVWQALGCAIGTPLAETQMPSASSVEDQFGFQLDSDLRRMLVDLYRPSVDELARQEGIDTSAWLRRLGHADG